MINIACATLLSVCLCLCIGLDVVLGQDCLVVVEVNASVVEDVPGVQAEGEELHIH